jgi:hypothetical protein
MNNRGRFLRVTLIPCMVVFCFAQPIYAQDSGAAKVYRTQFVESRIKVRSILERVDRLSRGSLDDRMKTDSQEEIFALTKLIHRLQEEAGGSNIDAMKSGHNSNKTLLLVSQGCIAMDFVLSALSSYIDTNDRAFLGMAKDGNSLINSIEKIL